MGISTEAKQNMQNKKQLSQCFTRNTKLLPQTSGDPEHPPIYMKLTGQMLESLREKLFAPSTELKVVLEDKNASFRIGNLEFQGTKYKEHGHVEVYLANKPSTANEYRRMGEVSTRVMINQDKPLVLGSEPDSLDLSQSITPKIVQLLALKPHTVPELAAKAHCSINMIKSVVKRIAEPQGASFTLKESFRPRAEGPDSLRNRNLQPDIKRSEESAQSSTNIQMLRSEKDSYAKKEAPGAVKLTKELNGTAVNKEKAQKRKSGYVVEPVEPMKELTKKPKLQDEEMFELARKFRNAYDEYLELYSLLQDRKTRPPSQVQKLLAMHNKLASWKKTLWSRSKQIK